MEYSYKFRLYPNEEQANLIQCTFGCARFVFNHYLAERIEMYKDNGKSLNYFEQNKNLTSLKAQTATAWLKDVDSRALQNALKDLDAAYKNFFRRVKNGEKPGFPKFKSKHNHRQSYRSQFVKDNIKVFDKSIQLPKLGKVKCRVSKQVRGRILSATVSQNPSGKYFVAICCTDVEMEQHPKTGAAVGLDMALSLLQLHQMVLSI